MQQKLRPHIPTLTVSGWPSHHFETFAGLRHPPDEVQVYRA